MTVLEKHPCARCGLEFYFASPQPPGWTCVYCREEVPTSAYTADGPDAKPIEVCPFCISGMVGNEICPRCWGEGKAD